MKTTHSAKCDKNYSIGFQEKAEYTMRQFIASVPCSGVGVDSLKEETKAHSSAPSEENVKSYPSSEDMKEGTLDLNSGSQAKSQNTNSMVVTFEDTLVHKVDPNMDYEKIGVKSAHIQSLIIKDRNKKKFLEVKYIPRPGLREFFQTLDSLGINVCVVYSGGKDFAERIFHKCIYFSARVQMSHYTPPLEETIKKYISARKNSAGDLFILHNVKLTIPFEESVRQLSVSPFFGNGDDIELFSIMSSLKS